MEKRKLQKTGGSSLTITLPKRWIDSSKLKDKDIVDIFLQQAGNLIIRPQTARKDSLKSELTIKNLDENRLVRELIARYLSGVDEVIIISSQITSAQRSHIRDLTNAFIGFEIVDESAGEIVIKNILDDKKFPVFQRIEKMLLITQTMFEDALKAFLGNDKSLAHDIIERDFEIDKLYLAITRQFNSMISSKIFEEEIGINLIDLNYFENISTQIERIADHAVKIARAIISTPEEILKKISMSENTSKIMQKIISFLVDTANMVQNLDKKLAHQILDKNQEIEKRIFFKKDAKSKIHAVEIITEDSLNRIRGYIMNIAEITIDQKALKEELE